MDYQVSVDIAAPPDVVWSVMADVERWHEWTPSVRGIRLLDGGPCASGAAR
jgi:carbon monoxide dehydrogenase subunit G